MDAMNVGTVGRNGWKQYLQRKRKSTPLLTKNKNIPCQRRRERNHRYPENRTRLFLQALPFGICGSGERENAFAGRGMKKRGEMIFARFLGWHHCQVLGRHTNFFLDLTDTHTGSVHFCHVNDLKLETTTYKQMVQVMFYILFIDYNVNH